MESQIDLRAGLASGLGFGWGEGDITLLRISEIEPAKEVADGGSEDDGAGVGAEFGGEESMVFRAMHLGWMRMTQRSERMKGISCNLGMVGEANEEEKDGVLGN